MRTMVVVAAVCVAALAVLAWAQAQSSASKQHRIVFEVTAAGAEQWTGVLNNVENVQKALGAQQTQIEVVAHGQALGMFLSKDNPLAARMKQIADSDVVFAACQNTMNRQKVTREDLLSVATTVDSGVAEVVRKQEAGWSYIKAGH